jgi:hypothetical protein
MAAAIFIECMMLDPVSVEPRVTDWTVIGVEMFERIAEPA